MAGTSEDDHDRDMASDGEESPKVKSSRRQSLIGSMPKLSQIASMTKVSLLALLIVLLSL